MVTRETRERMHAFRDAFGQQVVDEVDEVLELLENSRPKRPAHRPPGMGSWPTSREATMDDTPPSVVTAAHFSGTTLDCIERGWTAGETPGSDTRYVQRWTGSGLTRFSTTTLHGSPHEVLKEIVAGELLERATLADLPKAEMRSVLALASSVDRAEPAVLVIDGTPVTGTALRVLNTPVGGVTALAAGTEGRTIVVLHDGEPDGEVALGTVSMEGRA